MLTITGGRQTGKTHAALSVAIIDAISGRDVAYVAEDLNQARIVMERAAKHRTANLATVVRRDKDGPIIEFPGGGRILFMSRRQSPRGLELDTVIADVHGNMPWHDWNPAQLVSDNPRRIHVKQTDD